MAEKKSIVKTTVVQKTDQAGETSATVNKDGQVGLAKAKDGKNALAKAAEKAETKR